MMGKVFVLAGIILFAAFVIDMTNMALLPCEEGAGVLCHDAE